MPSSLPSIVIVGRPNVGKSTLFNRLTGTRRSIVTDEPGITRDRIYGTATWEGNTFEIVDTGGIVPDDKAGIPGEILRQAQVAIDSAAQLLLVVDARTGLTPLDSELASLLRRTGKPVALVANKVDTPQQSSLAGPLHELGLEVFPVSCEHGFGIAEMLDVLVSRISTDSSLQHQSSDSHGLAIAIVGRPNVGKSTLLNALTGEDRAIVSEIPGTTRDAVDSSVTRAGHSYTFIDTAGIRRKGKTKLVAEKLSVVMARRHLERADIALMVIDASQGVTSSDATIAAYTQQSGRSVIVVMNKWDLALEDAAVATALRQEEQSSGPSGHAAAALRRHPSGERKFRTAKQKAKEKGGFAPGGKVDPGLLLREYETLVRKKLKFLDYAPIIFISAKSGERVQKLWPMIDAVAESRRRRITTGELNRWLREVDLDRGTSPTSRKVKIFYVTQASSNPPTFVLFTNQTRPLHFSYARFLENQLRAKFEFPGTPIRFTQRLKETRKSRK